MFIVNIIKYKKLKKEYENRIEEHIIFFVVFILFFFELIIFTTIFLISKQLTENF